MTKADRWRPADGLLLEPNALRAAREPLRCLALTAGPGAGKTEMLAQRADFLLRTGTCRYPQRILAISFKVDAALNLKDRVRRRCGVELASRLDSHTFHAFSKRLIDRFRPVLSGTDALDSDYTIGPHRILRRQIRFDDMVRLAVQIIKTSEVARNAVRQTYSHVFLDEFQDCTRQQYGLISEAFLGSGISLTAVGDTKQRIMSWAGALEGVFQLFADEFEATSLNLYQNFRSQPLLRRMQNAMVKVMDPLAAVPERDLVGPGGAIEILSFGDSRKESEGIAELIEDWIAEGVAASEIAVLVSKQPDLYAQLLAIELERRGVPTRNEQALQELGSEPIAQLIVNFLRVVLGDRDGESYGRLMDVLLGTGIDEDAAWWRWHRFVDGARAEVRKQDLVAGSMAKSLCQLSDRFLGMVGHDTLTGLSADYEHGDRLVELVSQTHERITELLILDPNPLAALLRFTGGDAVRIMTIHKSKGLEFDSVVMLGVEKETFWGNPAEERSSFFVGISRAKRQLVLTTSDDRVKPSGHKGRWDHSRSPHHEFLGYASSVLD